MTLRGKLMLAQAPLALALLAIAIVSGMSLRTLGEQSSLILKDNYRSVLSAQRMKDAIERINEGMLFILAGHPEEGKAELETRRRQFEAELLTQEGNITEAGEQDATRRLRSHWTAFEREIQGFMALTDPRSEADQYFGRVRRAFIAVREGADEILAINQDAMVRKSHRAERKAETLNAIIVGAVVIVSLLGFGASLFLTARLLRPLSVVGQAVRRFGEGDPKARAVVTVQDEIGQLAREFNLMADRLDKYRASSLGELLSAQQSAQAAIDGLPDPVMILDTAGRLLNVNVAGGRVLAVDPDREGAAPLAGTDPGVRTMVDRVRGHVASGRGPYAPKGFEEAVRLRSPDGERYFLPRGTPIYGENGALSGVAIVLQDVTRLLRVDELKNNLVATVAHEFRTPLTSLRMAIHLWTDENAGPLTRAQADLLFGAREDCERLQAIVDDLLDLSRIESGHIELHRRRASPESLVDLAVDLHRSAAGDRRIELRSESLPGCSEVFADPDRIQIVFNNLMTNAIRYAPTQSEIFVRARPSDDRVRFEVTDAGPGIPREHQAGLFEKFFRVPGSPEGGSGLGLFISKGIIQAHGGEIGVDSQPGKGSTFWFTVPAAPEPAVA